MTKVRLGGMVMAALVALAMNAAAQERQKNPVVEFLTVAPIKEPRKMSFFVTSVGMGKGADLGGLAGADKHCQQLAWVAGGGNRTWRAYLSQSTWRDQLSINARDRIGSGPWYNSKGVLIAKDVEELHTKPNLTKETALDENWNVIPGNGDKVVMHDMLTGSKPDGTAYTGNEDMTCNNWRSSGDGEAMVGHHDRRGIAKDDTAMSWNSSHKTVGCSQDALRKTGGAGLFYCFAID